LAKKEEPLDRYSETVQGEVEGILAVPENLESRLPELKRRYLEYRKQKGLPDLPIEKPQSKFESKGLRSMNAFQTVRARYSPS
jgi:hypothetical protein